MPKPADHTLHIIPTLPCPTPGVPYSTCLLMWFMEYPMGEITRRQLEDTWGCSKQNVSTLTSKLDACKLLEPAGERLGPTSTIRYKAGPALVRMMNRIVG